MNDQPRTYDVIIAGFGPSGAVAAGLLGRLGHRTLVIDRQTAIYDKPRAIALDHEIYRHFDNMGIADAVAPFVEPFTASQHYGADGQLIRRIDMVPEPYPLGYTPSMVFTQPPVEAALRAHASAFSAVDAELGVELTGLADTGDHVQASLRDAGGRTGTVTARYLIGCDGASSTVRQLAGIQLEDLVFDEPWLVVDVLVKEEALVKLPQTSAQFCDPARPASFVIGPKNHRRWEIMLLPGEDPRIMAQPDKVWSLLSRWLGPEDGELWRAAAYRFHALVADDWRRGRVLIAGDAAHQQPPFFGQGMCQGVRDVTNLAWKLDRVLRGVSGVALLDTYTTERKQHVIDLTTKIKAVGESICIRDPVAARARDARVLAEGGGKPLAITRQEIIPPLSGGFIAYAPTPARGSLFPQPKVTGAGSPRLLDQITGAGWRLIIDGRQAGAIAAGTGVPGLAVAVIAPNGDSDRGEGVLTEQHGILAQWFDRHGVVAAIVRPDHYVYGTVSRFADLGGLAGELARRLKPPAAPDTSVTRSAFA